MKQFLLAAALIAVPVSVFGAFHLYLNPAVATTATASGASLGDLSAFKTIAADAQAIAAKGGLVAAEKRMTDFETAWDDAQSKLRTLNSGAWGNIDDAQDVALKALRSESPVPAKVTSALTALMTTLDDPSRSSGNATTGAAPAPIAEVKITSENGRPLPCEEMLKTLRAEMAAAKLSDADNLKVDEFQAKGTERCNADDDRRADEFFAQGLFLVRQ
ncbi:MAG: hypothetical protein H6905_00940 [Hyphomicrobiales bacterium]|nr:hypothetical protein [Hyphomicrobiales bacterium]